MTADQPQGQGNQPPHNADATAFFEAGSGQPVVEGGVTPVLSATDRATIEALRPGTALLVAQRGPNTGARFLLDADEVSVGRHPSSDIFLDDITVSRRHAVFLRRESGFVVQDIASLNGTYVNSSLVDSLALHTGDEVQIGKFRLVYYGASATA